MTTWLVARVGFKDRYVAGRGQSIVHLGSGREGSVPGDEDAGDSRNDRQVGERRRRVVDGGDDAGGVVARIVVRQAVAHDGGIGRLTGRKPRGGEADRGRLAGGHGAEVEDDPVLAGAVTGPQRPGDSLEGEVGRQRIGDSDTRGRNGSQVADRESVGYGLPGGDAGGSAGHSQSHVGRNHRDHGLGAVIHRIGIRHRVADHRPIGRLPKRHRRGRNDHQGALAAERTAHSRWR